MVWAGSWLRRRDKYSPDRSFGQRLETIDNQRGRPDLRGENTLARNCSAQLRVVMTAQRRLFGRYAITGCSPGAAMVLQLVPVRDGMCRFPPGLR